ncbi:MAG: cytochrome C peroxidase [Myxococcota bacterium]
MKLVSLTRIALIALALGVGGVAPAAHAQDNPCAKANPCNPCAAANPCNPCAGKNPCNPCGANPCNPCAGKNPCNPCAGKNPCNPCGAANPCNPCGAKVDASQIRQPSGLQLAQGSGADQLALGEKLWNDASLGNSGVACGTCHVKAGGTISQMNASFAQPYPHRVAMPAQQVGVPSVNAAEMVQFCMTAPMATKPLPWESKELAALSAYVLDLQDGFTPAAANPCAANPCNPCGAAAANPCNPCGAKANPCAANPCNPCGGKR